MVGYVGFDTFQLNATFLPTDAVEETIIWTSNDETIAKVSAEGVVTLVGVGKATITATSEKGLTDSIQVTGMDMQNITLGIAMRTPYEREFYYKFIPEEDGTYKFYADSYMGTYAKIYNSKHELVASQELSLYVNYEIVVALSAGETYVLCVGTDERENQDFYVYAKQLVGQPTSVEIITDVIEGQVGWNSFIQTRILPEDCIIGEITWTSSDETVVTVDRNGSIHFVGAGVATVTVALENGLSDSVIVRVSEKIEIGVGDIIKRTITEANTKLEFIFTPTESGAYKFYSTGEMDTYVHTYIDGVNINVNDDGESDNFALTYDFVAGNTYSFSVTAFNIGEVTFIMEKAKALSKVEIETYPTRMQYYEGLNNFYQMDGLKLKLTLEDGTEGYWNYGRSGETCMGYPIEIQQDGANVTIFCGKKTLQFSFELIENPVERIEVITKEMPEVIEGVDGWFDGDVFIYDLYGAYNIWDIEVRIHYKDGTSADGFVDSEVNGYNISWIHNQWEAPFTLGSDNYITITYAGKSTKASITVIENPVEKMELITAPIYEYIVGDEAYGYITEEGDYGFYPTNFDGFSFKLCYKGGAEKIYTQDDLYQVDEWYIDGREYNLIWNETDWVVGENKITFEYMGHAFDYTVILKESTVVSIEVLKAPVMKEYEYRYLPIFDGLQIQIKYTDNTTKVIEVTNENITYNTYAYEYGSLLIDGYNMQILEEWNTETERYDWQVKYLGAVDIVDEMAFVDSREITSIDVSGAYLTGDNVVLDVSYVDGNNEQLALDFVVCETDEWCPLWGLAKTKNGITHYSIEEDIDPEGKLLGYYVYVLGETAYVSLEEEEPEQTTNANIVVSSVTGSKGNQIKVTISLENNPGIISMKLKVAYDSSIMTLAGVEDKGNLGIIMHSNQFTNPYVLSWANDTALQDICFNGDVVTLIFDVVETAPEGEYTVSVSYDYDNYDICNFEQEKVKFNVVNGVVRVVDVIIGDVNGDGSVNTLDRIALARYLANWEGYTDETIDMLAADINCDGSVNTLDRIALARHLANWEGYEELPYVN